ncbi:hypothetical protein [Bacillus luti]|uniref:hypothetical protein n=1 Tax=Bacillus luti TaxID=2026191 RepID=UPI0012E8AFA4|nr:hypothetical protein [Bacillus luti]
MKGIPCECCHQLFSYPARDRFCVECCDLTIQEQIEKKIRIRDQMHSYIKIKKHAYIRPGLPVDKTQKKRLKRLVKELETDRQEILQFTKEIKELKEEPSVRLDYLFEKNDEKEWLECYKNIVRIEFHDQIVQGDAYLPF